MSFDRDLNKYNEVNNWPHNTRYASTRTLGILFGFDEISTFLKALMISVYVSEVQVAFLLKPRN